MKFELTCGYCNTKEILEFYTVPKKEYLKCKVCNESKNLKAKQIETKNVFGYSAEDKMPDAYIKPDDSSDNWPD